MEMTTTTKGQVVIPSSVRRKLGIKTGTRIRVELDEENSQIILKPITREYIHSLRGQFRGKGLLDELAAEKKKERILEYDGLFHKRMPKPKSVVLDSWAVMAFLEDEPAGAKVADLIADAHDEGLPLLITVANVGEVWYIVARRTSEKDADKAIKLFTEIGVEFVDIDWTLTKIAAGYKVKRNISYADCYAAALAKHQKAQLITGDREFKLVEKEVAIFWL